MKLKKLFPHTEHPLAWFFLGWGVLNSSVLIYKTGFSSGEYFWISNLALFALPLGLLLKKPTWVLCWSTLLLFTEPVWILDYSTRVATGKNAFGVVEYAFFPGACWGTFFLTHFHLFLLPFALKSLVDLGSLRKDPLKTSVLVHASVLAASYFLFRPDENVNCMHGPCIPWLSFIPESSYSAAFFGITFFLLIAGTQTVRLLLSRPRESLRGLIRWGSLGFTLVFVGLMAGGAYRKSQVPVFRCQSGEDTSTASISCFQSQEYKRGYMVVRVSMTNKSDSTQNCQPLMRYGQEEEPFGPVTPLLPKQTQSISNLVPYPETDFVGRMGISCKSN